MQKIVCLNKLIGKTPLEAIEKFRAANPEYKNEKLAYAGRLDPMAEGLLLVLVGDECKNRKNYERLPKTYEFEVLFGISTDTYDVMGIMNHDPYRPIPDRNSRIVTNSKKMNKLISSFIGKHDQQYPPFSSARVNGRPLFYWAREEKLDQIQIPSKEIEIFSLELLYPIEITVEKFVEISIDRISKVHGEFRQKEIIKQWVEFSEANTTQTLSGARFKITCSSGTYVRSIAHEMGKKLKTGAITFSIKRTKIGDYSLIK